MPRSMALGHIISWPRDLAAMRAPHAPSSLAWRSRMQRGVPLLMRRKVRIGPVSHVCRPRWSGQAICALIRHGKLNRRGTAMRTIRIDRAKRLCDEPKCGHNRYHPDIAPLVEIEPGEEIALETDSATCSQCSASATSSTPCRCPETSRLPPSCSAISPRFSASCCSRGSRTRSDGARSIWAERCSRPHSRSASSRLRYSGFAFARLHPRRRPVAAHRAALVGWMAGAPWGVAC